MNKLSQLTDILKDSKIKLQDLKKQFELDVQANSNKVTTSQQIFFSIFLILAVYFYGVYSTRIKILTSTTKQSPIPTQTAVIKPSPTPSISASPSPSTKPSNKPSSQPKILNTPKPTPIPTTSTQTNNTPISTETISQSNAVKKAKSYLNYSAFSYDGLVNQLEYEKFSHLDAVYGVDRSGANWNEQAAKKAKDYMSYSSFSRDGLIDQLKYEKFTQEQAEYGANSVGI